MKDVCKEEASMSFKDRNEEHEWRKKAKIRFYDFLHEQELLRRRAHKNLRLRTYYESYVIMNRLLNNSHSFSPIVQRRLDKIQKDWNHFTAFQRVDDAPATNNAIENYYSASVWLSDRHNVFHRAALSQGILLLYFFEPLTILSPRVPCSSYKE